MRIVNTGYAPRYLSYGDTITGGKTLEPGKESRDLPLSYVHSLTLWKDIEKGVVQIRLSDADRTFVMNILAAADKPITMIKPPAPPAPPAPRPPAPAKPLMTPVLADPVPDVPMTPGEQAVKDMMQGLKHEELKPEGKSLRDLMAENKGVPAFVGQGKKATMAEINTHMGNRV